MKKTIVWMLILTLLLCGCQAQPAETTQSPETTAPETVPATVATVPSEEETHPEEPVISAPQPGYYVVSSVGRDGDIQFYGTLSAENGWLQLNEDGTGILCFEGTQAPLTWSGEDLVWQSQAMKGVQMSYFDPELGREDSMVALYFLDPVVSICFRPASAPEEAP